MTAIFILAVLLIVCGSASAYHERKRQKADHDEYMAERIAFDASEINSEK